MAMPGVEDLKKLKTFIDFVQFDPRILNVPQLDFVRKFVENFGGKIPPGEFGMSGEGKCPFAGSAKPEAKVSSDSDSDIKDDSEPESDVDLELDNDGVIEGDVDTDQPMGDSSKEPTEEEIDQASIHRSEAAAAYSEGKFEEAIQLYTKAIELNPGNALFHAKRGQAFLKLQKPNACIRDCDKALELNCDSAAAYKFRGRAKRLLGKWLDAAKDLRQACKLDFDEEANEWLREVTPNAMKIEQHNVKSERKLQEKIRISGANRAEKKRKQRQQENKKTVIPVRFPGGVFPGLDSGFDVNLEDIITILEGEKATEFFQDVMKNPENINLNIYKSNPQLENMIKMVLHIKSVAAGSKIPGGFPNFPGGFPNFPGGFPNFAAGFPNFPGCFSAGSSKEAGSSAGAGAGAGATPNPEPKKPEPKKPDFMDDGLD